MTARQTALAVATAYSVDDSGAMSTILYSLDREDVIQVAGTLAAFYIEGVRSYAERCGYDESAFTDLVLRHLGAEFADASP